MKKEKEKKSQRLDSECAEQREARLVVSRGYRLYEKRAKYHNAFKVFTKASCVASLALLCYEHITSTFHLHMIQHIPVGVVLVAVFCWSALIVVLCFVWSILA